MVSRAPPADEKPQKKSFLRRVWDNGGKHAAMVGGGLLAAGLIGRSPVGRAAFSALGHAATGRMGVAGRYARGRPGSTSELLFDATPMFMDALAGASSQPAAADANVDDMVDRQFVAKRHRGKRFKGKAPADAPLDDPRNWSEALH